MSKRTLTCASPALFGCFAPGDPVTVNDEAMIVTYVRGGTMGVVPSTWWCRAYWWVRTRLQPYAPPAGSDPEPPDDPPRKR